MGTAICKIVRLYTLYLPRVSVHIANPSSKIEGTLGMVCMTSEVIGSQISRSIQTKVFYNLNLILRRKDEIVAKP